MIKIPKESSIEIKKKLNFLYGEKAEETYNELSKLLAKNELLLKSEVISEEEINNQNEKFTHKDIILNCYADSIKGDGSDPLIDLRNFSTQFLNGTINGAHILPFYEWDTDRGFSVLNFYNVDQRNGTWDQFSTLTGTFDILMVDCVLNHASIDNPIVQRSLIGDPEFKDFVIHFDLNNKPDEQELLKITRARPSPILTQYYVIKEGNKSKVTFKKPNKGEFAKSGWVWTTFSRPNAKDGSVTTRQVDLNFSNPKVLLEIINMMLFYVSKGASWIRLDAVGYLWKKLGTSCLHLPETHTVIELLAEIFSMVKKKNIVLISEVNEPQNQAVQYLGPKSIKKSDMIYLFTHYPLAVHAILTGTAKYYNNWLPSLNEVNGRLFISVLGTHDGMGMKPIGNWLPEEEKEKLQKTLIEKHNILPNYSKLPGGKQIIYELCSTAWNFINPENSEFPIEIQINRFLTVFGLGLVLKGVPSIYINGLLGIPNHKGIIDENRSINRQILNEKEIKSSLSNENTVMYQIFEKMKKLINIRKKERLFDLNGHFEVLELNDRVISVLLKSDGNENKLFALVNVTNTPEKIELDMKKFGLDELIIKDLISNRSYKKSKTTTLIDINLSSYQICWLKCSLLPF